MKRSAYMTAVLFFTLIWIATQGFQCSSPDITSGKLYYSQYENNRDTTKLNQALAAFEREVVTKPNSAEGWYWIGLIYGVKKEYIKLSDAWKNSLKISDQMKSEISRNRMYFWGQSYNNGVSALQKARQTKRESGYQEAAIFFKAAIELEPDSSAKYGAYLNYAVTFIDQGKYDEAVEPLKQAINKENSEDAYRILGNYYQRRGDDHKQAYEATNSDALAIIAMESGLKKGIPAKEVIELIGEPSSKKTTGKKSEEWTYDKKGYLIKFEESRLASTSYTPGNEPKLDKTEMDAAMKEYEVALQLLKEANNKHPNSDNVRSALIGVYVAAGRAKEALSLFKADVDKNPNDKITHYNYGVVLLNDKNYEEAIKEFEKALQIDAKYENALFNISRAYVNYGVEIREAAAKENPDPDKQSKEYLKQFEKSLPYIEKLLELKPGDVSHWELAGKMYASVGKTDKATEAFNMADKLRQGK